ncbi:molybdopterin molybdotransferase MoeA [Haliscomenobacter hydrossis]|uniref:Molybdopterin molybdenumtransferase n=1 Tax=Haliscomenobacter hydrossis (strain ATCC 27775 / DSM 1100 / LMG 10767 / O) TaxID=760192 RepID=F4L7K3_HALH1|nr:molybdopterin molybdotransferase MoeA [Haliscomenobacter hydrossis]AEE54183.1 molybdenum cofactor synthesis domain protein [Haliscomenobacter hydrossis DSM 1100]
MLTVAQAESTILNHALPVVIESIPLREAPGRILAEDLYADRDFPPFDRVTMDGIAIHSASFVNGQRQFLIEAVQAAGTPQLVLQRQENCIEVMTGAPLPQGTDTVIRYEDLNIESGVAQITISDIVQRQNIHTRAIDRHKGDLIISAGRKIGSAEMATAATLGKATLAVAKLPRTAIISTGDELVEIHETPLPHQIRRSNVYAIQAALGEWKIEAEAFHFYDDEQAIRQGVTEILSRFELVILSGAVSEGKFDFVPKALAAAGVTPVFHKVSQRPGKPFWFGTFADKAVLFALPGNPVSAFVGTYRYILPWLRQSLGLKNWPQNTAVLSRDFVFKPDLTYFVPVILDNSTDGLLRATPLEGHGSGDLANLNDADGFLELPKERTYFATGESFPLFRYRG